MNAPQPDRARPNNRRKEKRYKTSDDSRLSCRTSIDEPGQDRIWEGTTVDISTSGIRLLTEGNFQVGQPIWTELMTRRSHGVYRATIRRIEPWLGGQFILGCSLRDSIPQEVLQELANEGIINRRNDGRFCISHAAKVSWPLNPDELDVQLRDYSSGGLKLESADQIPADARVRLRFQAGGEEVIVEAKSVWCRQTEHGWVTGVALTDREAPNVVAEKLGQNCMPEPDETQSSSKARPIVTLVGLALLLGYVFLATF